VDFYEKNNIKNYVFEFDKNILELILSSNLAITRCGASTTAELVQTLTPFIAVPLPHSIDNHQYLNAKYYENKGCCWVLEQNNFNTENVFSLVIETIKNKNKLENIRENMKKNYNKNVYADIENEIKEFI
jgi:UDP-N-acetylglucosamine--N-acetylmuramyl-(pentapeptide) pyrophosphoryl-undecaprenol N-acetylglucosamine transferase